MKIGLVFALTPVFILTAPIASGQAQDSAAIEDPALTEITVPAQRVYLDPATGRLTDKPPPGAEPFALSPEELNMLSTSDEGLVQQPHPSGWTYIGLQGRFRHMAVATTAEDGTIEVREVAGGVFLPAESKQSNIENGSKEK